MELKGCKTEVPEFEDKFNIKDIRMSYVGKNNAHRTKEELLKIEKYLKEHSISDKKMTISEWYGSSKKEIERSINGVIIVFDTFECDIKGIVFIGFLDDHVHGENNKVGNNQDKVFDEYQKKYGITNYNKSMNFDEWSSDFQKKDKEMHIDPEYQDAIKRAKEKDTIANKDTSDDVGRRPIYIFHTHIDYMERTSTAGDDYMETSVEDEYNKFTKELIKIARGAGLKMELNSIVKCSRSPYLGPVFYRVEDYFGLDSFKKFLWNIKYICGKYPTFGCDIQM